MSFRADEDLERELADLEREDQNEYYTLLNVDLKATEEEIRSSYRRLCRIYHPDRFVVHPLMPCVSHPSPRCSLLAPHHTGTKTHRSSKLRACSSTASRRRTACSATLESEPSMTAAGRRV